VVGYDSQRSTERLCLRVARAFHTLRDQSRGKTGYDR
jgi:hypothetical protein